MFASRIGRVSNFCVIVMVLLSVPLLTGVCLGANPYRSLIISGSDYAALRARASQQPWAWMKDQAITKANTGYVNIGSGDYTKVRSCLTSSTLSYILDVPNQTFYKNRVYDGIVNQLDKLNIGEGYTWNGVVRGANTVFAAINALDVVYYDLTTTERTACRNEIQSKVNSISTSGHWPLARQGLHGTWKIFKGDYYNPNGYYNEIMADLTSDGVFRAGSYYANGRYNSKARLVKSRFMDILEHTGKDNRYYNNSRIQDFHEWLFTTTASPSKRFIPFGDTPSAGLATGYNQLYRSAKFGDTAAGYASWFTRDGYPHGDLYFSYVVPDELYVNGGVVMPAPAAVKPKSKIYYQGGGWFWEDNVTSDSLMGAVLAVTGITSVDAHCHKESNAIYMAAYGEHVLLNSGYPGYGQSWGGYSWSWFNNNARSANTVLINNADHVSKCGGGVKEGFTSHGFDYSRTDDGYALGDDTHRRNFIFIKPQDGKNGYFVLFDDVDADPGETVNVLLHPNTKATTGIETKSERQVYRAAIDGVILDGNTDVKLMIFYGTVPTSVTKLNGGIACGSSTNFEAKYLNAQYSTDSGGNAQISTILFPHDNTHAAATMYRINRAPMAGVWVSHGGAVDYVMTSNGVTQVSYGYSTFIARSVIHRRLSWNNELAFFFARDSVKFLYTDGNNDVSGFEADSDITIHLDQLESVTGYGMWGNIRSDGTYVKFFYNNLDKVYLNGSLLTPTASGDDWVRVYVASGTHELMILPGYGTPEPATAAVLLVGALGILRRRKRKR